MAKYLLPLLCLAVSCIPIPTSQCVTDPDCGEDLICDNGTCTAGPRPDGGSTACSSDETRPCGPDAIGVCKPGVRRCMNGVFETGCFGEVTASDETCNGLDDDCDGEVDDGVTTAFFVDRDGDGFGSAAMGAETRQACEKPMGFSANSSDCDDSNAMRKPTATEICDPANVDEDCDGVANEGCGCSNVGMTQACCSGRGTQTCQAQSGGAMLSMCTVQPSLELCNAVDDDCDGQTDEQYVLSTDGGIPALDAGTILPDGGCTIGVGACTRTAAVSCTMGALRCNAVAGTPGTEVCNGVDDNCDGQTDEPTTGLCAATGQTCNSGSCACPSGQTVCGASCETLGTSCSNGVGACARSGSIACVNGGTACDAVPGTPSTETCDGVDNNCDGTVDEGVTITCLVDADNDKANGGTTLSNHCPDTSRPAFGNCPVGYVAPSAATNLDCDDANANVWVLGLTRADQDGDGYCVGSASNTCNGATPPAGFRIPSSCNATDDCNDSSAAQFISRVVRTDADSDSYCVNASFTQCGGSSPSAGTRSPSSCAATDDCNDASAAQFISRTVRTDADSDSYCVNASFVQCGGAAATAGTRVATSCNVSDDCNDSSAAQYQTGVVRADGDNDGYCTGGTLSQCIGAAPTGGFRFANTCQATDDCAATDASKFRVLSVMADSDGDMVCTGPTIQQCTGQNPQPGYRLFSDCAPFGTAPIDCNDGNAAEWQLLSVRADADGDSWCVGGNVSQCTGSAPKPGYRLANQCAGDDCRDSNSNATSACNVAGSGQTRPKQCGFGIPATQQLSFDWTCPAGFQATYNSGSFAKTNPEARITDPASPIPWLFGTVGTLQHNFTCRTAAVGQDSWRFDLMCEAL